jgi:hypothetical protein
MPKAKIQHGVLCDTSFLIRLNNPKEELHANARGYLKYLLDEKHLLYVSTIALAEYAVRDKIENLPIKYFRVVPFNIDHAQRAGEFAGCVFIKRNQLPASITERVIIPNDTKMFAQADTTPTITHYLTADKRCEAMLQLIREAGPINFDMIPLQQTHNEAFGLLDLES